MRCVHLAPCLTIAFATLPAVATAQRVDSLVVGARVRVELRDETPPIVIGRWEGRTTDGALVIRTGEPAEATRAIARERVRRFELRVTIPTDPGAPSAGAARGFVAGAVLAGVLTYVTVRSANPGMRGIAGVLAGTVTAGFVGVGAFVGGALGPRDREEWLELPVP